MWAVVVVVDICVGSGCCGLYLCGRWLLLFVFVWEVVVVVDA